MPGPTTEILNSDLKDLRADVQRIEVSVAAGPAEVRTQLRLIIGIGATLLVTVVMGVAGSIWWASSINTDVHNLKASVGP